MKLASLYTNKEKIFPKITFKEGFNVVFAKVRDHTIKEEDSHNLGKTFLITVIDFGLLGSADKDHPFKEHEQIFGDFIFFLELKTHTGKFVTVRREVKGRSSISLYVTDEANKDLTNLPEEEWTYPKQSFAKAKEVLNDLLNLRVIEPETYRKGLGYVLRRQKDYNEVFRISKFASGKDEYWKPFVAKLLGFDYALIEQKYELETEINKYDQSLQVLEKEAGSKSTEYDEIKGRIEIGEASVEKLRYQLDGFSFREVESQLNDRLIYDIEGKIAEFNQRRYVIDYDLHEIERALEVGFDFDLQRIQSIFREAKLELPASIVHSYEEVVEFNKKMSVSRTERLRSLKEKLLGERNSIELQIKELDEERTSALAILEEKRTLEKYRSLQRIFLERETEVISLRQRLSQLDRAATVQGEKEDVQYTVNRVIQQIRDAVREENTTYSTIRTTFSQCVEAVLNVQALMSVVVNQYGNLEFNVRTLDRDASGRETSESLGTSYRKLLCACFDITLIQVYSRQPFYHFVYHDGIFEGLDNRKKVNLLNLIRRVCSDNDLQYILTVIDSDVPRDDRDQKYLFDQTEIIRELHDQGDDGRLFKTKLF